MLPNVVYEKILHVIVLIGKGFHYAEVVQIILDFQVHILHQTSILQQLIEFPALIFKCGAVILPCYYVYPHLSPREVIVTIKLGGKWDGPLWRYLGGFVVGCEDVLPEVEDA